MNKEFQEFPFYLDEILIKSIYRSLSPGNFFMTFMDNETKSEPITVSTPYNPFNEYICSCSTVWNPDFEAMKALLILGVSVKEELTQEQREAILEKKDDVFVFGTYDFQYRQYLLLDDEYTYQRKRYQFVIDNLNRAIKIIHIKNE